jgi:adenylate cyclase
MHGLTATQLNSASAERADFAVLYAEIRGFTRVSAILEPAIVIAGISGFFTMVAAAVERRGGVVRSMLNDNLMATFAGPANATHAVEAAQDILRDFTQIEDAWQRDYGFATAVAMGLHRGDVVVGPSSEQPGAPTLTVGDGLSIAARLLHRARTGEVVLSKTVMDAVDATALTVEMEKLPSLNIPRREPLEIYGVLLDTRLDFTI